jgi:UDP-N-acetylmuramate--alanine ligase
MNLDRIEHIYFLGIGGIGMSALARYFYRMGKKVSGYDKTRTKLTDQLSAEGISIHYEDLGAEVLKQLDSEQTWVVITPAVPKGFGEWIALNEAGFDIFKRAQVLGLITQNSFGIGVAGTHGKTTTSSMLAHVLSETIGCSAFLGGISGNSKSNLILDTNSEITVVEADEFDRSFLHLKPKAAILTSIDADHLDIYGNESEIQKSFQDYLNLVDPLGFALVQYQINLTAHCPIIPYGIEAPQGISGHNLRYENEAFLLEVQFENETWEKVVLGIPGTHNAENALAVIGVCLQLGLIETEIRKGLASFQGVKRRFEYIIKRKELVYIDDYAHHPSEIKALIDSIKLIYPERRITGVFQPHLFSRTRDFLTGFAHELSRLDEVLLMPIYPARELPIAGIDSNKLASLMNHPDCQVLTHEQVLAHLKTKKPEVLLTIGAGDIDLLVEPIAQLYP